MRMALLLVLLLSCVAATAEVSRGVIQSDLIMPALEEPASISFASLNDIATFDEVRTNPATLQSDPNGQMDWGLLLKLLLVTAAVLGFPAGFFAWRRFEKRYQAAQ